MGLFRYSKRTFGRELLFVALAIAWCVPAYILVVLSLKTLPDTFTTPLSLPTDPQWANYATAWRDGGRAGLGAAMKNSFAITAASVVLLILIGSLCAYVIARRPSRLSGWVYVLMVLGIILPYQLSVIPLFKAFTELHLTGSVLGMVLVHVGVHMPFVVFLYVGFIRALPRDYEEAAYVDGAGLLRTWLRVVFPLLLPVTGTVAILTGIVIWNDFFFSLIFLVGTNVETLPLSLFSFLGEGISDWNLIMAAVAITIAPVLLFYLFAQRQLIRGFAGGIKGG